MPAGWLNYDRKLNFYAGIIHDIVIGTVNSGQASVSVNGLEAEVANRSFYIGTACY